MTAPWDVIVVGGGNAGFCAGQSARLEGARVLVLEKAPRQWAGGNSYFTAGAMRTGHGGLADLKDLVEPSAQDRFPSHRPRPVHRRRFPRRPGQGDAWAHRRRPRADPRWR
ncbi:FAD-dependent oxidoreductase [Streptomyces sp. NPDC059850]|uniref:FAD-dependent oxidoreductase n=1 Tax=Streptomyces sp. NPDC059850 TaxID=3346970 RepID=UPI003648429C